MISRTSQCTTFVTLACFIFFFFFFRAITFAFVRLRCRNSAFGVILLTPAPSGLSGVKRYEAQLQVQLSALKTPPSFLSACMAFDEERAPRYEGEDVSPTTERELKGWYFTGLAAEIFAVCGVGRLMVYL